jgi:Fe-S cluster assembly ATP-binding protein
MSLLEIKNLTILIEKKEIIKNINLNVNKGEVHAIMGPNGVGKSTLAYALTGHPSYQVVGDIIFDGEQLVDKEVDYRAKKGLFLAMQNPVEIKGVNNSDFLRAALIATKQELSVFSFALKYESEIKNLKMKEDLAKRYLNDGFSGGEKKKNEILQMKMLKPKLAILDEIDSGLDVDAIKIVCDNINELINKGMSVLIITHYSKIFEYIKPTYVHILSHEGIVKTGHMELINLIDEVGYDGIK